MRNLLVKSTDYFQGTIRYKLYYSKFSWLIRPHIKAQIDFRLKVMNQTCLEQGSCVKCGCVTPALQMCNSSCDGLCYPEMMGDYTWTEFLKGNVFIDSMKNSWKITQRTRKTKTGKKISKRLSLNKTTLKTIEV